MKWFAPTIVAAAIGAASASPAHAQSSDDKFIEAVRATAVQDLKRRGYIPYDPDAGALATLYAQFQAGLTPAVTDACNAMLGSAANTAACTLGTVLLYYLPEGSAWLGQGSDFAGGGSNGGYDFDYCNFSFRKDADGNIVIPAAPLSGGGPMDKLKRPAGAPGGAAPEYWNALCVGSGCGSGKYVADTSEAVALYVIHLFNSGAFGGDTKRYVGLAYITGAGSNNIGYVFNRPSYYTGAGAKVAVEQRTVPTGKYPNPWTTTNINCPQMEVTGGDFHFYGTGTGINDYNGCVHFVPGKGGTTSGYAVGQVAYVGKANVHQFLGGTNEALKNCRVSIAAIAQMADEVIKRMTNAPPYEKVPTSSVRVPSTGDPTLRSLNKDARDGFPASTPPGTQEPTPYPTPTGTPGTGGTTNINVTVDLGQPGTETPKTDSQLAPPDFGWWPTPPSLSIGTSSQCPTYQFEAFGETYVVDVHCMFIEQNRAFISAIMILIFALVAGRIVMEA